MVIKSLVLCFYVLVVVAQVKAELPSDLQSLEVPSDLNDAYNKLSSFNQETEGHHYTMKEIINGYGYPSEEYKVVTEDGYVLTTYRIPYGKNCGPDQPRKVPVLIWHGLLCSSINYVDGYSNQSLAFILADECYDIWLGNSRGNSLSDEHISLDKNSMAFWNFSFHEFGKFDMPAVIDLIEIVTGEHRVHYIGHSQGTTQFFVYSSLLSDEAAERIISMHALAPVGYAAHVRNSLFQFFALQVQLAETFGIRKLTTAGDPLLEAALRDCKAVAVFTQFHFCGSIMGITMAFNPEKYDKEVLRNITKDFPAGVSTKQLYHYGELTQSGKFRQYGSEDSSSDYPVRDIRVPLHFYYGDADVMADVLDVERLGREILRVDMIKIPEKSFDHMDFLYAPNVKREVYDTLVKKLQKY